MLQAREDQNCAKRKVVESQQTSSRKQFHSSAGRSIVCVCVSSAGLSIVCVVLVLSERAKLLQGMNFHMSHQNVLGPIQTAIPALAI
eukprot:4044965-Amphidinium_carterae.1